MKEIKLEKDTIHVEKKNVYGNDLIYPVCERAKRFAILTGQKTLSDGAIYHIKRLGFSVREYINRELQMIIDVRSKNSVYITINNIVYYIDDSTGEQIIKKWKEQK